MNPITDIPAIFLMKYTNMQPCAIISNDSVAFLKVIIGFKANHQKQTQYFPKNFIDACPNIGEIIKSTGISIIYLMNQFTTIQKCILLDRETNDIIVKIVLNMDADELLADIERNDIDYILHDDIHHPKRIKTEEVGTVTVECDIKRSHIQSQVLKMFAKYVILAIICRATDERNAAMFECRDAIHELYDTSQYDQYDPNDLYGLRTLSFVV